MDDYHRDDLLAAMYQDDGQEQKTKPDVHIEQQGFSRTRKIRVGIVEYEVPTVEYVQRLEQQLAQQHKMIEHQKHLIDRLHGYLTSTRNFLRRQTIHLDKMNEDIQNKVDLREFT